MDKTRAAAAASKVLGAGMSLGDARELAQGWFFPFRSCEPMAGSQGVIVNKQTGALFHLGSAFPVERDLELYDLGYQFESYDLTITAVKDRARTTDALAELRLTIVEPKEEHGTVWRVPRDLTKAELSKRLETLPCVFENAKLYFVAELLEKARRKGSFTFELRDPAARKTTDR